MIFSNFEPFFLHKWKDDSENIHNDKPKFTRNPKHVIIAKTYVIFSKKM